MLHKSDEVSRIVYVADWQAFISFCLCVRLSKDSATLHAASLPARQLLKDTDTNGYKFPAGCSVVSVVPGRTGNLFGSLNQNVSGRVQTIPKSDATVIFTLLRKFTVWSVIVFFLKIFIITFYKITAQQPSLSNGSTNKHFSTKTMGYSNNGKRCFLRGPWRDDVSKAS
jgi:preprotein translocase subunit SecG